MWKRANQTEVYIKVFEDCSMLIVESRTPQTVFK